MLLNLDTIPWSHNLLASFSTWILLAGFLIIPGTFTSTEKSQAIEAHARENAVADKILDEVKHASLLYIAFTCCVIGGSGLLWLWWRWRSNYVWLINKIFIVVALNSVAGLISTLINVYTQQGGRYSITAKVTAIATGSCTALTVMLFVLYNYWILESVKRKHSKEVGRRSEKVKRRKKGKPNPDKMNYPALEAGSVV